MAGGIEWESGGRAAVDSASGDAVSVQSSRALPPGTPARGVLTASGEAHESFVLKVMACRRRDDGQFAIRGRLVSATREVREAFARAATDRPARNTP